MDAALVEETIRVILAVLISASFGALLYMARWVGRRPSRWVLYYLAATMGAYAVWRWFIVWLGIIPGETGFDEPTVRSIGNGLLILIFVAVFLMAAHHAREMRKGRDPT